ncbi:hypothetical protein DCCM_2434 [Desulfocucumis palustris]|uniref:Uncharacterized protein n=1 Tax=Desulfocucumis palustris TaxID=1898651 RepID=A0A2L2XAW6_9FIRM|nr:hypothetical protein DCCM_2434 [Desulfocucumis palustris]
MVETGQAGLLKITREAPAESVILTPVGRDGATVKGTMSERKINGLFARDLKQYPFIRVVPRV